MKQSTKYTLLFIIFGFSTVIIAITIPLHVVSSNTTPTFLGQWITVMGIILLAFAYLFGMVALMYKELKNE